MFYSLSNVVNGIFFQLSFQIVNCSCIEIQLICYVFNFSFCNYFSFFLSILFCIGFRCVCDCWNTAAQCNFAELIYSLYYQFGENFLFVCIFKLLSNIFSLHHKGFPLTFFVGQVYNFCFSLNVLITFIFEGQFPQIFNFGLITSFFTLFSGLHNFSREISY